MNFLEAKNEFRRRCMAANLAVGSLKQYEKVLKRFLAVCIKEGLGDSEESIEIEKITASTIRYYLAVRAKEVSSTTVRIHYMGLHTFFNFLYREELIKNDIMAKVEKPKKAVTEIPSFSKEEISKLLNVFDKETYVGYRNYTLTCLLFGTGLRRSEAVNLKLDDLKFDVGMIKVIGKGNKYRSVPIGDTLRRTLVKYIRIREKHLASAGIPSSPYVFINSRTGGKLQPNAISDLYRKIGENEHIKGTRVSPHTFRHSFAKYYLMNGGDVFSLQKTMGHSDIAVTKRYVHLNDNDIKTQNDKFNPLENESWRYNG